MFGIATLEKEMPVPVTYASVPQEIEYPESDGEPMAETDVHREQMSDALIYPLKEYFRDHPDVYVSGNLLLYYEKGNPSAVVSPDTFVVKGVPNHRRRTYQLWKEKRGPNVVFELTSKSTRNKDLREKRLLYEDLGVSEYFIIDPLQEYLDPPLQGFRLQGVYYVPITSIMIEEDVWQLESQELGLLIQSTLAGLRLYNPVTEQYLLMPAEVETARRQAQAKATKAQAEAAEAQTKMTQMESEIAHLRALLAQKVS